MYRPLISAPSAFLASPREQSWKTRHTPAQGKRTLYFDGLPCFSDVAFPTWVMGVPFSFLLLSKRTLRLGSGEHFARVSGRYSGDRRDGLRHLRRSAERGPGCHGGKKHFALHKREPSPQPGKCAGVVDGTGSLQLEVFTFPR